VRGSKRFQAMIVKHAGVDPAKVREALLNGFAASRILEVHGQKMIEENFQPGAKSTTQHKDMQQALELAENYHLDLPATRLTLGLYQQLIEAGTGKLDHSPLYQLLVASGEKTTVREVCLVPDYTLSCLSLATRH